MGQKESVLPDSPDQLLFSLEAMTSSEAKRQWRKAIKDAWQNKCAYCGTPPIDDKSLTIDHVKPRSRGGDNITRNCIPACQACNHNKGSAQWVAWFRLQPFYSLEKEIVINEYMQSGRVLAITD